MHTTKLWKHTDINNFLNSIFDLSEVEIKSRLVKKLYKDKSEQTDIEIENAITNRESFFDFIKTLDITSGAKWNLFCYTEDLNSYTIKFVDFIKKYLDVYAELYEKHREESDEFALYVEDKIKNEGMDYLKALTQRYLKIEGFDEIHVTTSFYNTYDLNFAIEDNILYVYIGPKYDEVMNKSSRENQIEKNLRVMKNLSDKTRFEISKFLLRGKYFGQEIANEFDISTAAVSYQMNYLFSANLVQIEKKDRKTYYALNKDAIRECVDFLNKEYEL